MALIMIVDDEEDVRSTLKTLFNKNGFETSTAENVDDCLKKLDKVKPDLILLDLFMPGKPVNELIEKYSYMKFIVISAFISENFENSELGEEVKKCLKYPNVVEKLIKPFDNVKLIDAVKKALKKPL